MKHTYTKVLRVLHTRGLLAAPVMTAPANGSTTTDNRPTNTGTAPAGSIVTV